MSSQCLIVSTWSQIVRVTGSPLYIEDTDWMCRKFVIGVTLLCGAVACALGFLTFWHAYLISTGQTSIEVHINRGEDKYYRKKGFVWHCVNFCSCSSECANCVDLFESSSLWNEKRLGVVSRSR